MGLVIYDDQDQIGRIGSCYDVTYPKRGSARTGRPI